MKKTMYFLAAFAMMTSMVACSSEPAQEEEVVEQTEIVEEVVEEKEEVIEEEVQQTESTGTTAKKPAKPANETEKPLQALPVNPGKKKEGSKLTDPVIEKEQIPLENVEGGKKK